MRAFTDTNFIEWQMVIGSHGIVPCGATGESLVLEDVKYNSIFAMTMSVVKGGIILISANTNIIIEGAIYH